MGKLAALAVSALVASAMVFLQGEAARQVPELGLPKKCGISIPLSGMLCFFLIGKFPGGMAVYLSLPAMVLLFSAYTDWHSKQLFSIAGEAMGMLGCLLMWLFAPVRELSGWIVPAVLSHVLICFGLCALHVWKAGDAKLIAFSAPYLAALASRMPAPVSAVLWLELLFLFFCCAFGVLFGLLYRWKHKDEKTFPFAPAIAASFCVVMVCS